MTLFQVPGKGSSYSKAKNVFLPHSFLAQKNLPAAIEDTGGNELPESIREKAEAVQAQGGLAALEQKFYGLPELLTRNNEIITEVCERLSFAFCLGVLGASVVLLYHVISCDFTDEPHAG